MNDVYIPKQVVVGLAMAISRVHKHDILGNIFETLNHQRVFFKQIYPTWVCNEERNGTAYDCHDYKCCVVIETDQQCYKCPATLTTVKVPAEFMEAAEKYIDSMYDTHVVDELWLFTKEFGKQWGDYLIDVALDIDESNDGGRQV